MAWHYLDFDWLDDPDGALSASALASPAPQHNRALLAEVQALLQTLHAALGEPGALGEGHDWDLELQVEGDAGEPLAWPQVADAVPSGRLRLSLHLAGGEALRTLVEREADA